MSDRLEDVRRKLGRANQHFAELHKLALATVLNHDLYEVTPKVDSKNRPVLAVGAVPPIPLEMSLLIGDTAHNLRSALDHLIWLFAKPTKRGQEIHVQFPIRYTRKQWLSDHNRMLPGVPRKVRAVVERLQPYHRRKWPETRLLGYIREIDNWDKHRALTTAVVYTEPGPVEATVTGSATVVSQRAFRGRLKPGTVLARFEMADPREGDIVFMKTKFAPFPIFDDRVAPKIRGVPVMQTLYSAGRFIHHDVLKLFQPLL